MRINVIDREGNEHALTAEPGATLMEVVRDEVQGVEAVCGGCCACATCHVWVEAQYVGERSSTEIELLSISEHFDPNRSRLSCQITLRDTHQDATVIVAPEE